MYKEIILFLESRADIASRLKFACKLSAMQTAKLIGFFVHELDLSTAGVLSSTYLNLVAVREAQERDRTRAAAVKKLFQEMTAAAAIDGEWRETDDLSTRHIAHLARRADLLLFGAGDAPVGMRSVVLDIPAVILESGCPVIVLPALPHPILPFRRILVAWKATKEARRAIHDALPLLREAEQVVVVGIHDDAEAQGDDSAFEIGEHLRRHGIDASVELPDTAGQDPGTAILSHAAIMDANLIVAGFYGHARLTEFILGGVSRTLLQCPKISLFLSH